MEQIQSAKNAFIKKVRSLKQKKYRDETGLFLAEGDKCAKEALQAGRAEALLTTKEDHQLAIQAERKCLGSPECRDDSAHSGCGGGGGCAAFRAVRGLYFPKGGASRHGQHFSFAYPNDG